ncbi:hypothetical protein AVEN_147069-1 [Araneus ventricosus]|uniref:Tc1-like transposase DDE domain-containing protein n=1 Tax=Araneus ventricosus TaxID=182803 RepID=A0A4Y2E2F9_ARAVE|nr:hypothetical protein AVEN_147069-1 [Araneus ventricosus]
MPLSDIRNVWFQHDGAPPRKVSNVQQYIRDTFQQQVIGYGGCVEWPPCSPDLNPLDFFLRGHIKQRVYATPPPTLQELRNCITEACVTCHVVQCAARNAVPCPDVYCCLRTFEHGRWMSLISGKCSFVKAIKQMCVLCFSFVSFLCARCFCVINRCC